MLLHPPESFFNCAAASLPWAVSIAKMEAAEDAARAPYEAHRQRIVHAP
jgi:hypothetical protein